MSRSNFYQNAAVWPRPLSERARNQIANMYPTISIDALDNAFEWYQLFAESRRITPEPDEAKRRLKSFAEKLDKFEQEASDLLADPLAAWVRRGALPGGDAMALENLVEALRASLVLSKDHIPKACAAIQPGRRLLPSDYLAGRIATILYGADLPVDATPTGPLVSILSIILEDVGEKSKKKGPDSLIKVAARVLRDRKKPA